MKRLRVIGIVAGIIVIIGVMVAGAVYAYKHRYDGMYYVNWRSGVVHNWTCRHFRNADPSFYKKEKPLQVDLKDCKTCKGRNREDLMIAK